MATEDQKAPKDPEDEDREDDAADEDRAGAAGSSGAAEKPVDPTVPRNRAERRAAAKAARRGQTWKQPGAPDPEPEEGATAGGEEGATAGTVPRRPRVPPRTMSKGTGDAEGVPRWVRRLGEYLAANRTGLGAGLLVVGVALGGGLYWNAKVTGAAAQAADAYGAGLTAYTAPVSASELPSTLTPFERARVGTFYRSEEERLRAANHHFRRAEQVYGSSRAAPLARLSEAGTLYQLGRYEDARALYRGLQGADLHGLEPRVLEGLAFTSEALGDLDGARRQYQSLAEVQGGAFRDLAQYYQARLLSRRGDDAGAKGLLHGLIERLGRITGTEATAVAASQLRDQATGLLRDIDPADPLAAQAPSVEGPGSDFGALLRGAGGPGQLSQEQLQRLLQQMQKRR